MIDDAQITVRLIRGIDTLRRGGQIEKNNHGALRLILTYEV